VILAEGFEEIEAVTCIDVLRRADIQVTVAGLSDCNVKGSRGITLVADKKLGEGDFDYDVCILPGGALGAKNLAGSKEVKSIIRTMFQRDKFVAAICASPAVVLAPLGILENKTATCYPGMESSFAKTTTYREEDVVIDGSIITSRGPATALLFALAIVEEIAGQDICNKLKKATLLE
jgi:4-methyl-5(b-hydroxyethyl)-thiazole monophosphate biosynthesis